MGDGVIVTPHTDSFCLNCNYKNVRVVVVIQAAKLNIFLHIHTNTPAITE